MKKKIRFSSTVVFILSMPIICSCRKDNDMNITMKDVDGNLYHTVTIGTQVWMVENLRAIHYNNGDPIPEVTSDVEWGNLTTGAYCNFDNSEGNVATFGRLYNWYAVNTGNLAPKGWHIPTDAEWTILENWLIANGYNYDGTTEGDRDTNNKIAKSMAADSIWGPDSFEGTVGNTDYPAKRNVTGFNALPGGMRNGSPFWAIFYYGYWWSSSEFDTSLAWYRNIYFHFSNVYRDFMGKKSGMSVRCVLD
jgi:uncharacterized protein (TIGR02145 family)